MFAKRPCRFYNSPKGCSRGDQCTFLHEQSSDSAVPQSLPTERTEVQQWLYQIPKPQTPFRPLGKALPSFFQQALKLMSKDANTRQEVFTKLASDGGLHRLNEAVEVISNPSNTSTIAQRSAFKELFLPIFQILSSEAVKTSFVLEHPLHTILNYLFGHIGRRATSVFGFAGKVLAVIVVPGDGERAAYGLEALDATAAVFRDVIDLNGTATLVPELKDVLDNLLECLAKVDSHKDELTVRSIRASLNRVQRRFGHGETAPEPEVVTTVVSKVQFKIERDAPGNLSHLGPRHDNDFADIKQIRIMPTAAEVHADRLEYLPSVDPFDGHLAGPQGLLDRHFRLLREDSVGQLRNAVSIEYQRQQGTLKEGKHLQQARTFVYTNAVLYNLNYHKQNGLSLVYEFSQPAGARFETTTKGRREWWQNSRRLQQGALVCLLDERGMPIFCSVSSTGLFDPDGPSKKLQDMPKWCNVYDDPDVAYVVLSLVDTDGANLDLVLDGYINGHGRGVETLIEFPGVLTAAFTGVLQGLQRMSKTGQLPFAELLAPTAPSTQEFHDIPPPAYATGRFRFKLNSLVGGDSNLTISPTEAFDVSKLEAQSTLDLAQAQALAYALTHRLALIQGPTGTGKSFTGVALVKVLLENKVNARLGPILVVTYTNHALDQLLMHFVEHGVEQIVRVGSRSKQEELEDVNLRAIAQKTPLTKTERHEQWQAHKKVDEHVKTLNALMMQFKSAESLETLEHLLNTRYPHQAAELFSQPEIDEEGFQLVHYGPRNPLRAWLSGHDHEVSVMRSLDELRQASLRSMSYGERRVLYESWIAEARANIKVAMTAVQEHFLEARQELDRTRKEVELRCLSMANVIGVTTTGLARITDLLSKLDSKVMLCEEAGEVLEAHTLVTLLPSIEHLILIGDHLQLKPHIQNYDISSENHLGKHFSFDVSMFERLVSPEVAVEGLSKVQFSTLEIQRRMHPSIAELIRSTLYPQLQDSQAVVDYADVAGMKRRLFWLDHQHHEAKPDADQIMATSHSNDYEVDMVVALVSHLVKQGVYRSNDIAVLTPYLGQLRKLRRELGKTFMVTVGDRDLDDMEKQGLELEPLEQDSVVTKTSVLKTVRVATVDNFQGEEAQVVIVSLVRSNPEHKVGFLRTPNRINVLLSRAKHGMYIIGNTDTAATVPMWEEVITILRDDNNVGDSLQLCCPRHPDTVIHVKEVDDFITLSPEGGCNEDCSQRLSCGHKCLQRCHSGVMHQSVVCLEPCQKPISGCDEHPCPLACGKTCPVKCKVIIPDVTLPCGHVQDLPCHETKDLHNAKCKALVEHTMKDCQHTFTVQCFELKHPNTLTCKAICGAYLGNCGHICENACRTCRTMDSDGETHVDHGACQHVCGAPFTNCSHSCTSRCHVGEGHPLCEAPCEEKCAHSACKKKCFEPCTPCAEPCTSTSCGHGKAKCDMPCAVPCNKVPCSERCQLKLKCGCQCPSLCCEQCPDDKYCQNCGADDVKNIQVDFLTLSTYEEVNLDEDPCLFPACGHVITVSSLDGHFDMAKHYDVDGDNHNHKITGIKAASEPFSAEQDMKRCPTCRASLRSIQRYSRVSRRALLDESTKRFITWAQTAYVPHERSVMQMEDRFADATVHCAIQSAVKLKGNIKQQFRIVAKLPVFSKVFADAITLRIAIEKYAHSVAQEEQPYNKVRNMVEDARKRKNVLIEHIPDEIRTVQMRHSIQASALLLRFDLMLISKVLSVKQSTHRAIARRETETPGSDISVDFQAHRVECDKIIEAAGAAHLPAFEADANILFARYAALEVSVTKLKVNALVAGDAVDSQDDGEHDEEVEVLQSTIDNLTDTGMLHLVVASSLCDDYPGQCRGRREEIVAAENMLRDHFYAEVSSAERREIFQAMATEFNGSGHWYYCVNGHPFTIGECGMPMEEARCPQCNAAIGGHDHVAVDGVQHAVDIERELAGLQLA